MAIFQMPFISMEHASNKHNKQLITQINNLINESNQQKNVIEQYKILCDINTLIDDEKRSKNSSKSAVFLMQWKHSSNFMPQFDFAESLWQPVINISDIWKRTAWDGNNKNISPALNKNLVVLQKYVDIFTRKMAALASADKTSEKLTFLNEITASKNTINHVLNLINSDTIKPPAEVQPYLDLLKKDNIAPLLKTAEAFSNDRIRQYQNDLKNNRTKVPELAKFFDSMHSAVYGALREGHKEFPKNLLPLLPAGIHISDKLGGEQNPVYKVEYRPDPTKPAVETAIIRAIPLNYEDFASRNKSILQFDNDQRKQVFNEIFAERIIPGDVAFELVACLSGPDLLNITKQRIQDKDFSNPKKINEIREDTLDCLYETLALLDKLKKAGLRMPDIKIGNLIKNGKDVLLSDIKTIFHVDDFADAAIQPTATYMHPDIVEKMGSGKKKYTLAELDIGINYALGAAFYEYATGNLPTKKVGFVDRSDPNGFDYNLPIFKGPRGQLLQQILSSFTNANPAESMDYKAAMEKIKKARAEKKSSNNNANRSQLKEKSPVPLFPQRAQNSMGSLRIRDAAGNRLQKGSTTSSILDWARQEDERKTLKNQELLAQRIKQLSGKTAPESLATPSRRSRELHELKRSGSKRDLSSQVDAMISPRLLSRSQEMSRKDQPKAADQTSSSSLKKKKSKKRKH